MSFFAELLAKVGLGLIDRALKAAEKGERAHLHELPPKRAIELCDHFRDVADGLQQHAYRGHLAAVRKPPDREE